MTSPQVSVLLPVHNAAATLPAALVSLRAQTLRDFEIVAIDDGSTDDSARILEAFAAQDGRLKLSRRAHAGLVPTLNAGLALARAPLIARFDADDIAAPERLAAQWQRLHDEPGLGVVGCLVEGVAERGALSAGMARYIAWLNAQCDDASIRRARFIESPLAHPSVMMRRELASYRDCAWPEDYDLWLRLLAGGVRFGKVQRVLLKWRDSANRLSRSHSFYSTAAFRACKLHHLLAGPLASAGRVLFWGAGSEGKPLLRGLRDRGVKIPFVVDVDPRKIGQTIHGAKVIGTAELPRALVACDLGVVAVGVPSARAEIRGALERHGWRDGQHFFFAA
jgi:glycosyltransferase involved in cell wall biosynthesis